MSEALKPYGKEVQVTLQEGYEHLQTWWQGLSQILPDSQILQAIATHNTKYQNGLDSCLDLDEDCYVTIVKPCSSIDITLEFPRSYGEKLAGTPAGDKFICTAFIGAYEQDVMFVPNPEIQPNSYWFSLEPEDQEINYSNRRLSSGLTYLAPVKYIPSYYPFRSFTCKISADCKQLEYLAIRHQALKAKQKVVKSCIELDNQTRKIRYIYQAAKDETFFPRPNNRHTTSKPTQVFSFRDEADGPQYRFNYKVSFYNPHRLRAQIGAVRNSFLPYPGFTLTKAIEKACRFKPVVSRGED